MVATIVKVLVAAIAVGVTIDESFRYRTLHLGLCAVHKVHTMALGMSEIDSLEQMNKHADEFVPHLGTDLKLRILAPINVNEKTWDGANGVWSDPCAGTAYGCQTKGRPVMVLLPGVTASPHGYTGATPSIARAGNASMLVCDYKEQDPVAAAAACVAQAQQNATTVFVTGTSTGAAVALMLHKKLVSEKKALPQAYWLISPWMPVPCSEAGPKDWTRPACANVTGSFDITLTEDDVKALPPTLVSWGTKENTAEQIKAYVAKLPTATADEAVDMPHEFVLFADWVARAKASIRTAKTFFTDAVSAN